MSDGAYESGGTYMKKIFRLLIIPFNIVYQRIQTNLFIWYIYFVCMVVFTTGKYECTWFMQLCNCRVNVWLPENFLVLTRKFVGRIPINIIRIAYIMEAGPNSVI